MANDRVFTYPGAVIRREAVRAGLGLAVGLGGAVLAAPVPWLSLLFAGLAGAFGIYLARAVARGRRGFVMTEEALTQTGRGAVRAVRWDGLRALRCRYYATRKDHVDGWMELSLTGASGKVTLDSDLPGFTVILARAAQAARDLGLDLDRSTHANLSAALSADGFPAGRAPSGWRDVG